MLKYLLIKNYALISDAEIELGPGLNILTGETGAGKSILIGALGTILGERVNNSALRDGTKKTIVEGYFDISGLAELHRFLKAQELEEGDNLLLRREISDSGRSRAFINDTPVQLNVLQSVGDCLVDLHGQHEHQSLLRENQHLAFLDDYGGLESIASNLADRYGALQAKKLELERALQQQAMAAEKLADLKFQIDEIAKIDPNAAEEENLLEQEKRLRNRERLFELTREIRHLLYDGADSVFDMLNRVLSRIDEIAEVDSSTAAYSDDCRSATVIVEELAKSFQTYNSDIEFDPNRLDSIQERLSQLAALRKKYQKTLPEIVQHRESLETQLSGFENIDTQVVELRAQLTEMRQVFGRNCMKLSNERKAVAADLEKRMPELLAYLGMPRSRFKVTFEYQADADGDAIYGENAYASTESGIDFAKFALSANVGEALRPLSQVASGGEISRIMLALKAIMAKKGRIPVMVFDEIDSGVSGRIAQAVGRKLKDLSQFHQIVCITHLPQIASMASQHYMVEKCEIDGRTHSNIRKVGQAEREQAIATLLAGEVVSETHLNAARELLQEAGLNKSHG